MEKLKDEIMSLVEAYHEARQHGTPESKITTSRAIEQALDDLAAPAATPGDAVRSFRDYLGTHDGIKLGGHAMDDMALDLARIALDFKHLVSESAPVAAAPKDVVAWMQPETRDLVLDEQKIAWLDSYGKDWKAKAERYTVPLGHIGQPGAVIDAASDLIALRDEYAQKTQNAVPGNEHWGARFDAKYQALAAAIAAAPALEAPAAPDGDLALIIAALEHGQPQMTHYAEPRERHAKALAAARRLAATPRAPAAPSIPQWIDDPHDIEQGQMLNPAWVQAQAAPAAPVLQLPAARAGRIYVAGPMTGLPDHNFPAFNAEAENLRAKGWHVENPAEHGIVDGAEWADYLHYDMGRLATCSAVHLLPGWSKSRGAVLEVHVATTLGMPIFYADGAEPVGAAPAAPAVDASDKALLDFLRDTSCDLRSIDVPTGGDDSDVHWRVIAHYMSEPREREIGRSWSDDPREAIRAAIAAQATAKGENAA